MRFAGNRIFLVAASVVIAANARGAVELGIDVLESNGHALLKNKRVELITNRTGVSPVGGSYLQIDATAPTNLIAQSKRGKREMFFKCYGSSSIAPQFARGVAPAGIVASWRADVARFKDKRSENLIY
jgi:uncharacterized protein YbbC (DUF1343 family)